MHFTFKREAIATAIISIALPVLGVLIALLVRFLR
jgi:hypothetical protein